ncbi:MAG: tetratricopeptide repeat protein, partial [Chitinivibrionales bacterium]
MRLVLFSIVLFALAAGVSAKPEEAEKVEETEKRSSKTGLMVAVPVDITGGEQSVDTWLSVITGKLFGFRLQAKGDIFTVPIDSVYRRVSKQVKANNTVSSGRYADLAEEFNADYVLHTTIEYDKNTEGIILMLELKSVNSNDYFPYEMEFSASEINRQLDAGIEWVFQEIGAEEIPRELERFYSIPVISKDIAILKNTGELMFEGYFAEGDEYRDIIDRMEKTLSRDSRNLIVQFAIAQLTERAGDWELAADEYENLVSIIPNYPVIYTSLCRTLRLNGEYKKALDYAESAEKKKIRNRALLIEGALSLEALGRFSKAERIFDPVLKSDPDNIYALRFFARKYNREDEPEKALEFSNKLLSLEPENGHGILEKGRALKKLEEYENAIEYSKRAVSILKDKREPLEVLGDIHFIEENYTTSAEYYDRILDSWDKSYDIFLNSAAAWTRAERPEKALEVLVEAESLYSDSSDLFKKLGLLYYELKDTSRAVLFLEKYRSVKEEVETLLPLGEIYASKGKYEKAFYMYNHALDKVETEDEEILCQFKLAKLYLRQKNTSPVIKTLGEILEKRPEYPKLHLYMGDAWFIDKNYEKALEHYLESRERGVEPLRVLGRIAFIRYHFGDYEEAVEEYLNYVEKEKDNPQAFYNLAVSELYINEIKSAEAHLKKGLSLGKPGSKKWFEIAEGYEKAGKNKRVIDAYKKGLAIEPDHRKALLSLSEAYEKAGDMVSVADCYMRVFDLDNEEHKDLLAKAGLYYEENGKMDKARE